MSMTGKGISSKTYRAGVVEGGTVRDTHSRLAFSFSGQSNQVA